MNDLVRLGSYPIIFGITAFAQLLLIEAGISHWPYAILVAGAGMSAVAILERVLPDDPSWNLDHEDTLPDILHATSHEGNRLVSLLHVPATAHVHEPRQACR